MPNLIHHIVDTSKTDVGSVTPLVQGLIAELADRGFSCSLNHAMDDPHETGIEATREADVVHIHACNYEAMIGAAWLAKRLGKPFVISPAGELAAAAIRRHPWRVRWRGMLYERRTIGRASVMLGQNDAEAEALRQRYRREVSVLPYGISSERANVERKAPDVAPSAGRNDRCVLMLAPIEPKTGCATLLKAFAEIGPDANDWRLVIAGSDRGEYRKMLEAAIRRKGGGDRVELLTANDEKAEDALLAKADVLVAPSLEAGHATSILKAASLGVPILASRQVLPDALDKAVVACEADRAGIREGLRRMVKLTDQERSELIERAKGVIRETLDWRILADQYVSLYNSLA